MYAFTFQRFCLLACFMEMVAVVTRWQFDFMSGGGSHGLYSAM